MFKFITANFTSVNCALLMFGKNVPILQVVNSKMIVDITNMVITAIVTLGVAYISAKFQKKDKV